MDWAKPFTAFSRLSLNQMTTDQWDLEDAVAGCAQAGIPEIGLWRHKVEEIGLDTASRLVREAGLRVSSLCRGGMFPAATERERRERLDDNRRAIDEAVTLGTDVLVLVCGPAADSNIAGARRQVVDAIESLVPYAADHGVKLGIEPLHPMFAADRSVITTIGQANDMIDEIGASNVGVIIDVYHVWWDPQLYREIERARGRIYGFHVNDWIVPLPDILKGRGMMGDGVIQLRRIRGAVEAAGYTGPIEVEIFNEELWSRQGEDVLTLTKERFLSHV